MRSPTMKKKLNKDYKDMTCSLRLEEMKENDYEDDMDSQVSLMSYSVESSDLTSNQERDNNYEFDVEITPLLNNEEIYKI